MEENWWHVAQRDQAAFERTDLGNSKDLVAWDIHLYGPVEDAPIEGQSRAPRHSDVDSHCSVGVDWGSGSVGWLLECQRFGVPFAFGWVGHPLLVSSTTSSDLFCSYAPFERDERARVRPR